MAPDAQTGSWSLAGTPEWIGKYYLYEVEVFVPASGRVERNLVTDPYSVSLSRNSPRSQIVDLDSADADAAGLGRRSPSRRSRRPRTSCSTSCTCGTSARPIATVPAPLRGTFKAFTLPSSLGPRHLQALADAGLTHVHLLPAFDFATVDEDRTAWPGAGRATGRASARLATSSRRPSREARRPGRLQLGLRPVSLHGARGQLRDRSRRRRPDPASSARWCRRSTGAGLRVVMDVVYNHTNASAAGAQSVLDRIVPGYYHRLERGRRRARRAVAARTPPPSTR